MSDTADLLVEIGTEELPPKALRALRDAFAAGLTAAIDAAGLAHGAVRAYATPRRLAVAVEQLAGRQPERRETVKGPPVRVAFDDDGKLTRAGHAFAEKCGVAPDALERIATDKGEWLACEVVEAGEATTALVPGLVEAALAKLPVPRRMRWGANEAEFVRPVHWVVLLYGGGVVDATILGLGAGRTTFGHRFHAPDALDLRSADDYETLLEKPGYVIADFDRRREHIVAGVAAAAADAGGEPVGDDALYDEVTALVEWPVPLTGGFDEEFLRLPREVIVSTLTSHQRYFPLRDTDGKLLARFVTVANLESRDPEQVREGNERVIRPRLADAAFFWDSDRQRTLDARRDALSEVVYQQGLGSLHDKSARTAALCEHMTDALAIDGDAARRAAELAKCDLLTGLVGEFPELQGTMGRYYAEADGEPEAVAAAIGEQYLPRFAGDDLPATDPGRVLAIADKLDTLAGIFVLGKRPSGNRDPFGLRRAALGVIRVMVECRLDLGLDDLIRTAVDLQPAGKGPAEGVHEALYDFITERLRHYFLERDPSLATETFEAVVVRRPPTLVDFEARLAAVQAFIELEPAASLAAANKRIANILKQAGDPETGKVVRKRLVDDAEVELWQALAEVRKLVAPKIEAREYTAALTELAGLRPAVDRFFDEVLVMADNTATRNNRLALLAELRALFLEIADISLLGSHVARPEAGTLEVKGKSQQVK